MERPDGGLLSPRGHQAAGSRLSVATGFKVQAYCPQPGPCPWLLQKEAWGGCTGPLATAWPTSLQALWKSQVKNAILTTWSEASTRESFMDTDGPWWLASPSAQRCEGAPCPESTGGGKGRLTLCVQPQAGPSGADPSDRCRSALTLKTKLCAHCTKINKMKIIIIIIKKIPSKS